MIPKILNVFVVILFLTFFGCVKNNLPELEQNFKNPPATAKPRTWMHVMSGNMSKEGLTKDLESIAHVGIGGVLLFNISQGIPNGRIKYNSDEHHALIQHAAAESERLGLSFGVHNCDGWSSSGGPWITPEESMKMVVWSETFVEGGKKLELNLAQPTTREAFYKDIAVIAYPSLLSEMEDALNKPAISASDKDFETGLLNDLKIDKASIIKKTDEENPWIQYNFERSHTIRSVVMVFNDRHGEANLQVSDDGVHFNTVRKLFKVRIGKGEWAINDHFEGITSRFFRLQLNQQMTIKEARLMATYSFNNVLGRTSIARTEDAELALIGKPESTMVIDKNAIVDLSENMDRNGLLKTTLPQGNWTIMRFGYTSTGAYNHPASEEGRGLECDKLNRKAFKKHYDSFVKRVVREAGPLAPNALQYIEIDSYEMGGQNWTEEFATTFKERKGYDITNFLPLLTGRFVESATATDAILWDFRDVVTNLMTENYYGYFTELCHQDGLMSYIEPYGFGPVNDLDVGGKADINMGEFWMNRPIDMVQSAVSASHIYGKNVISAESFTSTPEINWKGNPAMAKLSGDRAWALGINEFMFHRFAHQANTHVKPGMTMNRWGFHFDRTQTWWENAGADWFKYIARGSYLLRQGVPVSDLLIFVGDGTPNSVFGREDFEPSIPKGTNFDCVNADVLINRVQIADDKLMLPEGTSYKALVLKNCDRISLKTLSRIHELAAAGIPIIGSKPKSPAGYLIAEEDRKLFDKLVDEIWKTPGSYSDYNWEKIFGELKFLADFKINGREDIDFMHRKANSTDIYFFYNPDAVARSFDCTFRIGGRIPEFWNPMNGATKKLGQFFHKDGLTKARVNLQAKASAFIVFRESSDHIISVRYTDKKKGQGEFVLNENNILEYHSGQSEQFKVLLTSSNSWDVNVPHIPDPVDISGPWEIEFLRAHDFEANYVFDELLDWKDHPKDEIQHYSGTAIYRKSFSFPLAQLQKYQQYLLDLGDVKIVAEVKLNGKELGVIWMPPFVVNISEAIVPGNNTLELKITNQWSNRLIGDERYLLSYEGFKLEGNFPKGIMPDWYMNNEPLPDGPRTTFCTAPFYKAGDPLMPSGLLGPVHIKMINTNVFTKTP